MEDVQNNLDGRCIPIQKVGIKDLRYPIVVRDRANQSQSTVATINLYVDLPHSFKGTHMSRFVDIINKYHSMVSVQEIGIILTQMLERFQCEFAHSEFYFPYFIKKNAPVSLAPSLMDYQCAILASLEKGKAQPDLLLKVCVPINTLCPCSKAISIHGAHNQRSQVTIQVRSHKLVWIEELIEIAEAEASVPLYSALKREDEKKITEQAYANPKFVEDIVRGVSKKLKDDPRIKWYKVESENYESIHNHNAYAMICDHTE